MHHSITRGTAALVPLALTLAFSCKPASGSAPTFFANGKQSGDWRGHEEVSRLVRERLLEPGAPGAASFDIRRYLGTNRALGAFLGEFTGDARNNAYGAGRPNTLGALVWTEVAAGLAEQLGRACANQQKAAAPAPAANPYGGPNGLPGAFAYGGMPSPLDDTSPIVLRGMTLGGDGAGFVAGPLCDVATAEGRRNVWAQLVGPDDLEPTPSTESNAWEASFGGSGNAGLPPPADDPSRSSLAPSGAPSSVPSGAPSVTDVYLSLLLHPYFLLER
jgi:hypothetical protein